MACAARLLRRRRARRAAPDDAAPRRPRHLGARRLAIAAARARGASARSTLLDRHRLPARRAVVVELRAQAFALPLFVCDAGAAAPRTGPRAPPDVPRRSRSCSCGRTSTARSSSAPRSPRWAGAIGLGELALRRPTRASPVAQRRPPRPAVVVCPRHPVRHGGRRLLQADVRRQPGGRSHHRVAGPEAPRLSARLLRRGGAEHRDRRPRPPEAVAASISACSR